MSTIFLILDPSQALSPDRPACMNTYCTDHRSRLHQPCWRLENRIHERSAWTHPDECSISGISLFCKSGFEDSKHLLDPSCIDVALLHQTDPPDVRAIGIVARAIARKRSATNGISVVLGEQERSRVTPGKGIAVPMQDTTTS
jgi:hypothetical protein